MIERSWRKPVRVGPLTVGGDAPISVQSMTKTDTRDIDATVAQIHRLEDAGCDLVRVAVPDEKAARALGEIKRQINIPLIADIHYHGEFALIAIEQGVDKIRLNPGNLRKPEMVSRIAALCRERDIPIRVGANAGSVAEDVLARYPQGHEGLALALVDNALEQIALLEREGMDNIIIALKAFDIDTALYAYRAMADRVAYPFHVGITEAGLPPAGIVRSVAGLTMILSAGLGDTLRVSLTAEPEEEVRVGIETLRSLRLRTGGLTIVACPSCGRVEVDLHALAKEVEEKLRPLDKELAAAGKELRVSVMGCVVNALGEARDADVGLGGGKNKGIIFRHGERVNTVPEGELVDGLIAQVRAELDGAVAGDASK